MKDKITIIATITIIIGIMWFGSKNNITTSGETAVSEGITPYLLEDNTLGHINNELPETPHINDSELGVNTAIEDACTLTSIETDAFTFGDAFEHYRQCLGSDSSFQWKENTYTTILAEEVIIQLADSVQVKEGAKGKNEVSDLR